MNAIKHPLIVALLGAICVCQAMAAEIYAGFREQVTNDVPAGMSVTQSGRILQSPEGKIVKTGEGAWTVPVGVFDQSAPLEIGVAQGSVAFTAGEPLAAANEPAELYAKAAVHFDASTEGRMTEAASGGIEYWYDVRDTAKGGMDYYCANARKATGTSEESAPSLVTRDGGRKALYFGGYKSGLWMQFRKGGADTKVTGIKHVFLVQGIETAVGHFLSSNARPTCYYPGDASTTDSALMNVSMENDYGTYSGRIYINGMWKDGFLDKSMAGWRLYEVHHVQEDGQIQNFFNLRNSANTQGGDCLSELVVFTNNLTEVERLKIENHLMTKWNLKTLPDATVRVAEGASVQLPTDSVFSGNKIVTGEGTLTQLSENILTVKTGEGRGFQGTLRLAAGAVDAIGSTPFAVDVRGGETLQATNTLYGSRFVTTAGTSGVVTKTGDEQVRIRTVDAGAEKFVVEGGMLVLGGEKPETTFAACSGVEVFIPNHSFEECTSGFTSIGRKMMNPGEEVNGWTAVNGLDTSESKKNIFYWDSSSGSSVNWAYKPIPDGNKVFGIQRQGGAYTTIEILQDGTYELSLYCGARQGQTTTLTVDVKLGERWETAETVASFFGPQRVMEKRFFRLENVKAGTYVFGFQEAKFDGVATQDATCCIDDVHLRLVPDAPKAATYKIPFGDFERLVQPWQTKIATSSDPGSNNKVSGWTLSKTGTLCNNAYEQPILIGLQDTPFTSPKGYLVQAGRGLSACDTADIVYGGANLAMFSNVGKAQTTFAPPAGTYRLRGRLARWSTYNEFNNVSGSAAVNASSQPSVRATVTIGGTATVLGTLPVTAHSLTEVAWPTAFTVTGSESVTLTIEQTAQNGGALADDFDLEEVPTNLLTDGGFETETGWIYASVDDADGACVSARLKYDNNAETWGYAVCEGNYRLRLTRRGVATQEIEIPADGLYCLSFSTSCRADLRFEADRLGINGRNPIAAWLAADGVTNEICTVRADTTNYVDRTFVFSAKAGTYTFGFSGRSVGSADRTSFVDAASIVPLSAEQVEAPTLPETLEVNVSQGAKLQLDYAGSVKVGRVKLGGRAHSGIISAETYPEWVSGPGELYVEPKGMILMVK